MNTPPTLDSIKERWAFFHAKLDDPSVSHAGRNAIKGEIEKLRPQLQAATVRSATPVATPKATPVATLVAPQLRSLDFDYYMVPLSQNVQVLIDRVWERWTRFHPFRQSVPTHRLQHYRSMVEGIVLNLVYAKLLGLDGVRISRTKGSLNRKGFTTRYKPEAYTESLLMILDDLDSMKVLRQLLGDRWRTDYRRVFGINPSAKYIAQNAKRTVLLHAEELRTLMATFAVNDLQGVGFARERQEVIVLKKDESSALVEYEDTDLINLYRQHLRTINAWLAEAGPLVTEASGIDDRQRFLVRKFTYGSITSGGRLWEGFWMNLKREQRPAVLRIHGESTSEVDFSCIMIRLAYASQGINPPEVDLYNIPGLSSQSRPGIKKVISAMLFDETKRTRFPMRGGNTRQLFTSEDQVKGFTGIHDLIVQHHAPIAHLFGTSVGHFLQFVESQIIVKALLHTYRMDVVTLPIHDCLITRAQDVEFARTAMQLASREVVGHSLPVEVKGAGQDPEGIDHQEEEVILERETIPSERTGGRRSRLGGRERFLTLS
jgi:hypothetical protein